MNNTKKDIIAALFLLFLLLYLTFIFIDLLIFDLFIFLWFDIGFLGTENRCDYDGHTSDPS